MFEDLIMGDKEMARFKRVRVIIEKIVLDAEQDLQPLPNRVLDVQMTSLTHDTVCLYLTNNSPAPYACFSYCCRDDSPVTTMTNNNESRKDILVSDLPSTIRDAIFAVRNLGLRFLWVDSICSNLGGFLDTDREVNQMVDINERVCDLNQEITICRRELNQMVDIYRNSYITLVGRKYSYERRAELSSNGFSKHLGVSIYSNPIPTAQLRSGSYDLESRGWTFEEETVSPRVLYLYP